MLIVNYIRDAKHPNRYYSHNYPGDGQIIEVYFEGQQYELDDDTTPEGQLRVRKRQELINVAIFESIARLHQK